MTVPRPRFRQPKQLDAGALQAEIRSFKLRLAAEGKAAKTIRTYTEAVQWFAAASLLPKGRTSWEQVDGRDAQQWMAWLLERYSGAYASNQYRALQQFFKWLAVEDELPNPMDGLQPPPVPQQLVPVFTDRELSALERACAGRSFTQRRDTAIIAVFTASGIRLSELAGIRYHPDDPRGSDIDLWQREITVRGKGRKDRIVKIGHQAAVSLDRYLRARARLVAAHVAATARRVVNELCGAAGASTQFADSPFQRAQRDVNTISGHVVFDPDAAYSLYGRIELGMDPGPVVLV